MKAREVGPGKDVDGSEFGVHWQAVYAVGLHGTMTGLDCIIALVRCN